MNVKKEFIPRKESLELKELGFDEPCIAFYEEDTNKLVTFHTDSYQEVTGHVCLDRQVNAPTFSQTFRFFRDKHELTNSITDFIDDETNIEWDYEIAIIGTDLDEKGNYKPLVDYSPDDETRKFKSYEEAELACLKKLIEILKNKVI